jgi:peptidoglycan/xylan/chitin deacetylase (PgdA/CDA1 family)
MNGDGYGPGGLPRAVVLTFDNLGEASALERGTWSPETPLGSDPSVIRALPGLLDELDDNGLTATFFVEAVNSELNPRALHEIVARGHELGVHGWSHEPWASLAPDDERELLERSTQAFGELGVRARGFRPPGGNLTPRTRTLLRQLGYVWCSPAARAPGAAEPEVEDGVVMVPFQWELVDAYHLMDRFSDLRVRRGDAAPSVAPRALADRFQATLGNVRWGGAGVQTLVLHPFLMLDAEWRAAVRRLLALLAELARERQAWVVPGGFFADWLTAPAVAT